MILRSQGFTPELERVVRAEGFIHEIFTRNSRSAPTSQVIMVVGEDDPHVRMPAKLCQCCEPNMSSDHALSRLVNFSLGEIDITLFVAEFVVELKLTRPLTVFVIYVRHLA